MILRSLSKYCLFFVAMVSLCHPSIAQKRCSAVESEATRYAKYKHLHSSADIEKWIAKKISERRNSLVPFGTLEEGVLNKIAIVVHVIHNGETEGTGVNISDEQIYSQIEVLNEDYQRKNADTVNTQTEFMSLGTSMPIEFVLARQTEFGEATNGIVRVRGTKDSFDITIGDRELLSSLSHWNPDIYLNIWVTNLRSPYIGIAQFPDYNYPGIDDEPNTDNAKTDGIVIDYQAFGSVAKVPGLNLLSRYNLGRTTTHEMGHFFGLKHVWGDDTSVGGCSVDDFVTDTPNSNKDYSGLCTPADHVSCGTNDMFENYLYYTNDACMNIFTREQVNRMQAITDFAPRRFSLLNSSGTEYPESVFSDIALNAIMVPGIVLCEDKMSPILSVRNNGSIAVTRFTIDYTINGNDFQYNYDGDSVFTGEFIEITLPEVILAAGTNYFKAQIQPLPDEQSTSNNTKQKYFVVDNQTDFIPLREQFSVTDLEETNWISVDENNNIGWEIAEAPLFENTNTSAFINLYNYENRQESDWLISPELDFTEINEASLFFRVSYARNADFNDQLYVMASDNCGATFDSVLDYFNSSTMSSSTSDQFWTPAGKNDWLTKSIDLQSLAGKENVRIAFRTINDFGNNLYLDDIEFYTTPPDQVVTVAKGSFIAYPNPTTDGTIQLAFNTSARQMVSVRVVDTMGRVLYTNAFPNTLNQTYTFDFTTLSEGIYIIYAQGEDFIRTKKIMIGG